MSVKKNFLLLFVMTCVFLSCSSSDDNDDSNKGIKLSVENKVTINSVDFEFDILRGSGDYTVSVANKEDARATVTGNKVKVNMLNSSALIVVTDKDRNNASVSITSSDTSLISSIYAIIIDPKTSFTMDNVKFGAGGYEVTDEMGTSANVEVTNNDQIKVTTASAGDSFFVITDKRGKSAILNVLVFASQSAINNVLTVNAEKNQRISFILKWGTGNWSVTGLPDTSIVPSFSMRGKDAADGSRYTGIDLLTSNTDIKGEALLKLESGNSKLSVKVVRE